MNKIVNFEDSIFILEMRVRMVRDSIVLDADPELFLGKMLDDICFIDDRMRILLGQLQGYQRLIDREELLEQFVETESQFYLSLEELLTHEGNISIRGVPSIIEKVTVIKNNSRERRRAAVDLSPIGEGENGVPMISTDELKELLKAF